MNSTFLTGSIAIGAALACAPALADNNSPLLIQNAPVYSFSAFGTLGVVQTNTNDAIYTTGNEVEGATKHANMGPDSKVGAQLDAKFNDVFSATLQVFSKQNGVSSYAPDVEWAFGKLKLGDGFDLRLGRIGAPFFMTSDFRNVGYTNLTVRTPFDVYGLVPVRSFDGGDILYRTDIGSTTLNGQVWLGKSGVRIGQNNEGDEDIVLHNIAGINFSAENGPLTVRFGTMKTRFGVSTATSGTGLAGFNGLLGGLNQLGAYPGLGELTTIADELSINGKFASFTGVGAVLDTGNWVVNTEYVKRRTESTYIASANAWYATLGYRIDTFTPYVSFSNRKVTSTSSYPQVAVPGFYPPEVQQTVPFLVGSVNGALTTTNESTSALGVRWDAGKNYDVKAEFQQIRVPANSAGAFGNISTGVFLVDTKVNVVTVAVDFVF